MIRKQLGIQVCTSAALVILKNNIQARAFHKQDSVNNKPKVKSKRVDDEKKVTGLRVIKFLS